MIKKLVLLFTSLLLCLLAFEVGVRWADLDYNPNPYWRFHPQLGWTQEKGASFDMQIDHRPLHFDFNALGFRDVPHSVDKPPGTRRVVILGDSFSEALQVNLEETYWRQLGKLLTARTGTDWEVINLGVGDWGNAQAYLALHEYGLGYHPDLVISQIFPLNDICNNTLALAHLCKSQNDDYRPYLIRGPTGLELTWTQPLRQSLRSHLISFGVLERLFLENFGEQETGTVDEIHQRRSLARGFKADPLLLTYASDAKQPPEIQEGWATTEAILEATYRTCRAHGIGWAALVIPFEGRINGDWPGLAATLPGYDPDVNYPEKRLGRFFSKIGAPALMLKPIFDANKELVLPYIGGHLNLQGHVLAARALADFLSRSGLL